MRLGILGGSFNPIHFGHLLLAECCREQRQLEQVWFLPAATPPHKQDQQLASDKHRIEMLQLSISGNSAFSYSTREIDRGGISYTVDTLEAIAEDHPEAEIHLLMGADSLHDLPNWRSPQRICELAIPTVASRADSSPNFAVLKELTSAKRLDEIRNSQVNMPQLDLSGSDLRARARDGRSLRYRTPRAVDKYIETHRLYQIEGGTADA